MSSGFHFEKITRADAGENLAKRLMLGIRIPFHWPLGQPREAVFREVEMEPGGPLVLGHC